MTARHFELLALEGHLNATLGEDQTTLKTFLPILLIGQVVISEAINLSI
jgi:hypothetical protein